MMQMQPSPVPRRHSRLVSLGTLRAGNMLTSAQLASRASVTAEWTERRSGISSLRHAGPDDDICTMAVAAGKNALDAARLAPSDVDCLIVVTQTHLDHVTLGPDVAHRLGADGIPAYELHAGAGFTIGLAAAADEIGSGDADHVLLIASEVPSACLDPADPRTAPLFGDGAAAVVVGASKTPGIGPVIWGSDGAALRGVTSKLTWSAYLANRDGPRPALSLEDQKLTRWILQELPAVIERALVVSGVKGSDLAAVVLHQANGRILEMVRKRIALPDHVVFAQDIVEAGNTMAASIPLAIEQLLRTRRVRGGDLALLADFGAGVTYAAQVVELPALVSATDKAKEQP